MEIVVSDTNIFIDLYSIGLLDNFFELPLNVHTVDFVINELTQAQQHSAVSKFTSLGKLTVKTFDGAELQQIFDLNNIAGGNVSFQDCSLWYYAQCNGYALLTGDGQLRSKAIKSNVTVRGIIYIFDLMVEHQVITPTQAVDKMDDLTKINPRLPHTIIRERIATWRGFANSLKTD